MIINMKSASYVLFEFGSVKQKLIKESFEKYVDVKKEGRGGYHKSKVEISPPLTYIQI